MSFEFGITRSPSRIIFGAGQRHALTLATKGFGERALICTDRRLSGDALFAEMRDNLAASGLQVEIFDGTEPELPLAGVLACVDRYRSFAPDVIIGIGGGSCLDMAKLVALLLSCEGPVENYYGEFKVPHGVTPVIALPTTSGTGSEVTPVAVLADPRQEMKIGISSPELIPHTAICDPELTLTCPAGLTAISGADALAHAIEAFAAVRRSPGAALGFERVFVGKNALSDQYALNAIDLLMKWLPVAVADGQKLEARSAVMLASTLAGLAFGSAGTASAHALQYPVGAKTKTAHGLGVGVLLPYTMEFNLPASAGPYSEIARRLGLDAPDDETAARALISAVADLFEAIGIPKTLAAIGFNEEHIAWAGEHALKAKRLIENNPRQVDVTSAIAILRNALTGLHDVQ